MKITISRVEVVVVNSVKNTLEVTEFTDWLDAFEYLEKHLNIELSVYQKMSFYENQYSVTSSNKEMVNTGVSAYLADVCYAVEVTK